MDPRIGFLIIGHRDYQNDIGAAMAKKAAEELEKNKVQVIFRPEPAVSAMRAGELARGVVKEEVDGVIVFLGTWIECSTAIAAIREVEHLPLAIWGFPMFETQGGKRDSTGSFVGAAVLKGALDRMGYFYKLIIGLPDDRMAISQAVSFAKAAQAGERLKRTRLGLIGYASMGMYPGTFDHILLRKIIGPEVVHIDTYTLIHRAEQLSRKDCQEAIRGLKEIARVSPEVTEDHLFKVAKLYLAAKQLTEEHQLQAINIKCQYELSQTYGMVACLPLSLLAEDGIVCGCEGDVITTVSMVLLNYLTGEPIYYGDVLDIEGDTFLLSSCGFVPFSLAKEPEEIRIRQFEHKGFKGIHNSFVLKPGKVTFARLVEGRGDYKMNLGTGSGIQTELRQERFPAIKIRLDGCVEKFIATLPSQHYAIGYGDLTSELADLARILKIETIRI